MGSDGGLGDGQGQCAWSWQWARACAWVRVWARAWVGTTGMPMSEGMDMNNGKISCIYYYFLCAPKKYVRTDIEEYGWVQMGEYGCG